jgi:hypothetical protein
MQTPTAPPTPPAPGESKVTVNPDGRMVIVSPDGSTTISYPDGRTTHVRVDGVLEQVGPPGSFADTRTSDGEVVSMVGVSAVLAFVVGRWWTSRRFRKRGATESGFTPGIPLDLGQRIERIEHAVESVAIEVERISEGQRFTTRLLAERPEAGVPIPVAARPEHVGGGRQ